jgi:hypothetical protein
LVLAVAADLATGQRVYYYLKTQPGPTTEGVVITDGTRTLRVVPNTTAGAYSPLVVGSDTAIVASPSSNGLVLGLNDTSVARGLKIWPSGAGSFGRPDTSDPGVLGTMNFGGAVRAGLATYEYVDTAGGTIDLGIGTSISSVVASFTVNKAYKGIHVTSGTNGNRFLLIRSNATGNNDWLALISEDTSVTAANRLALPANAQILGPGGAALLYHEADLLNRWVLVAVNPGRPLVLPCTPSDYSANTGTWTVECGDIVTNTWVQFGKLVRVDYNLVSTQTTGSPTALRIALPFGFYSLRPATSSMSFARIIHNAVAEAGFFFTPAGAAYVEAQRINSTAFTDSASHGVQGTFWFEAQ